MEEDSVGGNVGKGIVFGRWIVMGKAVLRDSVGGGQRCGLSNHIG